MQETFEKPRMHKGVAYYPSYIGARAVRDKFVPDGRLISYGLGWAIQYRISGPYYPENRLIER